ncbi:PREDICTED: crocetin glucosyltransferase, chloroplastic-like [Populus euphratica]|uniref:Glycosyltransferase n=1 Tax=Populus euphratica TaxID=75702 RepID=A0AAJ6U025_POPEU|nr:PREDICTED: crocetin glucosyltransferase, chloroplastic-like [Populus euphratica]
MGVMGVQPHILLVTFPAQGHINPALQFAKRLVAIGAHVTFSTSMGAARRMSKTGTYPEGLSFAAFDDGSEHGFRPSDDINHYFTELRLVGSKSLAELIVASSKNGRPFTRVVYSNLIPWVAKVARELKLPSTLLWNQSPALLDIFYYYFNGYGDTIRENINDPTFSLKLPGLPPLGSRDLPSFFNPRNTHAFAIPVNREHIEVLDEETNPKVLVNTFDALECEALNSIGKYKLVGVGPLIPSAFLDGEDPTDTSFGGDLFQGSKDHIEWLNSKPESSVIYIAFGSISALSKPQKEEMARALLETGRPFLWVIRADRGEEKEEGKLSCNEELEKQGKIVPWCSQVEVLSHPSIGCFVTHCGWNSTFESLSSGVPMVAFPQWTDQLTNAKMVEDVWKTGVRVTSSNKEGVVEGEEIERCLELVMGGGERGSEIRKNAKKWKELARQSSKEGGSSYNNLKAFVDEIAGVATSFEI